MSAKVIKIDPLTSHDVYDRYETPSPAHQRYQRALLRSEASVSPDQGTRSDRSTPLSHPSLRRTPRFVGTPSPHGQRSSPRPIHLEAVSVGISPPGLFATADPNKEPQPDRLPRRQRPVRQLSQDLLSSPLEASTTVPPDFVPPRTSSRPVDDPPTHPLVQISKHTHSAILWALEEALRHPNPFTPDLLEENASMSDIRLVGGPADLRGGSGQTPVTNGFGSPSSRPTAPPAQTGSPSGIKGPKKIMEERAAREAAREQRKRQEREEQERERLERAQAENEARQMEEHQRRMAQRRAPAAGAAASGAAMGGDPSVPISTQPIEPAGGQRRRQPQPAVPQTQQPPPRMQPTGQGQQRTSRTSDSQPQPPLQYSGVPNVIGTGGGQLPGVLPGNVPGAAQPRNTFPHAFERWEALSSHWEGLTSFWIRKLQQHADEIDRDPVSAQLSRQVSDLSAAGANLFHAVVELQRLRASSERKFQRWFFETRAELERHEETKAALEQALSEERLSKANAIKEALENDNSNSKNQKRFEEMRKELLISKEEARRAWEELGRREQEERDRTISLQQGMPTIVGGVQVVPMTQGVPSRGNNPQEPRQTQPSDISSPQYPQYSQPSQGSTEYTQYSQGSTGAAPSTTGGYYQQSQGEAETYTAEGQSEGGYSEGEYLIDDHGNFIRDSRGHKIPYPGTPGDDDSDSGAEEYETPSQQPGANYPPSASHQYSGQPDYSGSGYAAPGWDTMPRHHHPTRLSDVLEEDETRSRTSAGQSQVSRH